MLTTWRTTAKPTRTTAICNENAVVFFHFFHFFHKRWETSIFLILQGIGASFHISRQDRHCVCSLMVMRGEQ